jgi:AraC-like DNA-binding protein
MSFKMSICVLQKSQLSIKSHEVVTVTPERAYILPHPGLRDVISHYTICFPKPSFSYLDELHIVPDASGCIVFCLTKQGVEMRLWGPTSQVTTVKDEPQITLLVMVEFLPCGAGRLLNMPLSLLHNEIMPLEEVDPRLSRRLADPLHLFCKNEPGNEFDSLLVSLDQIFMRLLEQAKDSALARHITSTVMEADGALRVSELSVQTGYSQRHLNRVMSEKLGMSIKLLSRIIRINAVCRRMAASSASLTDIAHRFGYHDQSHFIHDFSEICGTTPSLYHRHMSDFYNENLKLGARLPSK